MPTLDEVFQEVHLLESRLRQRQADVARACGLTSASSQLLEIAATESATVPQLARTLGQTRQGVQRVADVLVENGMASYVGNPHHRRSPRLRVSEQGRAALASLEREVRRREPDVEHDFEPEEVETTLYVLRALRETL